MLGAYRYSLVPEVSDEKLADLAMPFDKFLEKHGLLKVNPSTSCVWRMCVYAFLLEPSERRRCMSVSVLVLAAVSVLGAGTHDARLWFCWEHLDVLRPA